MTNLDSTSFELDPLESVGSDFELETLKQRLVSIVLECQDAILVKDASGTIRFWNSGAEALYGWTAAEMVGRSVATIIPEDRQSEWRTFLESALRGERTDAHETLRVHRDGSIVEVSVSISPITDEAGRIIGASSIGRGISRQKDLERGLLSRQVTIDRIMERERMLADASALFVESFDVRDTLRAVGPLCVPLLGDLCVIDLVDEMGDQNQMRFGFSPETNRPDSRPARLRFAPSPERRIGAAEVIRTGEAQFFPKVRPQVVSQAITDATIASEVNLLGVRSAMIVPMCSRGEVVGSITLIITSSARRYDIDDLHFAERFAERVALAVDNARLWNERQRVEDRLRASEAKYRLLADPQHALLWSAPADGRRTFFSEGWLRFTGMELHDAFGWGWLDAVHPDDRERVEQEYRHTLACTGECNGGCEIEYRLRIADDSYRWVVDRAYLRELDTSLDLHDGVRSERGYVGNCTDITDRKIGESELAWRATHDALTGLANRSYAFHRAAEQLQALQRHPGTVAVIFIDVDNLKTVNDQVGHSAGDELLRMVANRLSTVVRKDELLARIGGDEFLVVTGPSETEHVGSDLAGRLLAACDDLESPSEVALVGVSIGVASTSSAERDLGDLIDDADSAMYKAKAAGGHRFCVFGSDPVAPSEA